MPEQNATAEDDSNDTKLIGVFLEALPSDLPGTAERYGSDDISWTLPPTVPGGSRPWKGKPAVMKFLGLMQAGFEPGSMRLTVHEIVGARARYAARVSITARSKSGKPYENDYAFFLNCRDGKITQVVEYVDTARVLAVFG
jgi:ketosteroid isomerase-like protein